MALQLVLEPDDICVDPCPQAPELESATVARLAHVIAQQQGRIIDLVGRVEELQRALVQAASALHELRQECDPPDDEDDSAEPWDDLP